MMRRLVVALLTLVALLAASTPAGGVPHEPLAVSTVPPDAPTLTAEEALLDDAEEFAKLDGVSIDEALRRIDLQFNVIPSFETAVAEGEQSRFSGLFVQNKPAYRVVVLLTSGTVADIERFITDDRLRGIVEVRRVQRNYKQLKAAQERVLRFRSVVDFDADVDVASNVVRVFVQGTAAPEVEAKASALRQAAIRSGEALPDWVEISGVSSLSRPALEIFGGLSLSDQATSGFSVTGPGNSGGVTTAAHITNSLSYAGNSLTFKGEVLSGSFDIQWHSKSNTDFPAKIYRGQGVYGPIDGKKARWNQPIGTNVCKRGITTDRTCGPITSKDFLPGWIPNAAATFIVADAGVAGGDSGGPVFVGTEAWGTTVGVTNGGDLIYMAANYIESSMSLYIRGT